jgi:hypothetical protein
MKTYTVSQNLETLGDPCETTYETLAEAEAAAETLKRTLAEWIANLGTPDYRNPCPSGCSSDINAWRDAEDAAGIKYDDDGNRTPESPRQYGLDAGWVVANAAVQIEENETDDGDAE